MKQSLTYHLTLWVLKLKGLKKIFSQDPIDYHKLRKEDVLSPKGMFFKEHITHTFKVLNTTVTQVTTNTKSNKLLIFIHGGAFISGPGQHHWDTIKSIIKQTDYTIWLCEYPKAPEHKITEISNNIDAVYQNALQQYEPQNIRLIGDSVGGTLLTALMHRVIANNMAIPQQIILVCPVMDATLSNPQIDAIDKKDPMLSKTGILSAKKMCAENEDLTNINISPIHGSFDQFPETILFAGENDIMYPDQKILIDKLKETAIKTTIVIGENMPHIWPFLPVMKEAKLALSQIIKILNR